MYIRAIARKQNEWGNVICLFMYLLEVTFYFPFFQKIKKKMTPVLVTSYGPAYEINGETIDLNQMEILLFIVVYFFFLS